MTDREQEALMAATGARRGAEEIKRLVEFKSVAWARPYIQLMAALPDRLRRMLG